MPPWLQGRHASRSPRLPHSKSRGNQTSRQQRTAGALAARSATIAKKDEATATVHARRSDVAHARLAVMKHRVAAVAAGMAGATGAAAGAGVNTVQRHVVNATTNRRTR